MPPVKAELQRYYAQLCKSQEHLCTDDQLLQLLSTFSSIPRLVQPQQTASSSFSSAGALWCRVDRSLADQQLTGFSLGQGTELKHLYIIHIHHVGLQVKTVTGRNHWRLLDTWVMNLSWKQIAKANSKPVANYTGKNGMVVSRICDICSW